ncbi:MAG: hypothetical protein IPH06_05685 [Alphaproteobacteria bacterium]|jgi:hypothetical protein|nr:hypothetical protein [Alphaproteobacteria bacterium]QQS57511.1 MAG: hypothetical protein IPN28_01450 [Alphaproteobacteria bacterium]
MDEPADKAGGSGQVEQVQSVNPQFTSYSFSYQHTPSLHTTPYLIDSIRLNGELVSQEILTRLDTARSGQKLVVGFGELHENGAHIVLEHDVVHKMVVNGVSCAFAVEWPPNNIDLHIDDEMKGGTADKAGLQSFLRRPGNERLREKLSADTTPIRSNNARLSRTALHQYLDNHGIPVFCADAPRDWSRYITDDRTAQHLLADDPKAAAAIAEAAYFLHIKPGEIGYPSVNALHQFGMLARNLYMLHEAEDILDRNPDIQILFLQAGRAHITGNHALLPEPSPYEHGLSWLFAEQSGHVFVPVPFYGSGADREANTPPDAMGDLRQIMLGYVENTPFNVVTSNISDKTEAQQLRELSPYFDYIGETLDGRDARELREERKEALMHTLERIRDENHLVPAPDLLPH